MFSHSKCWSSTVYPLYSSTAPPKQWVPNMLLITWRGAMRSEEGSVRLWQPSLGVDGRQGLQILVMDTPSPVKHISNHFKPLWWRLRNVSTWLSIQTAADPIGNFFTAYSSRDSLALQRLDRSIQCVHWTQLWGLLRFHGRHLARCR
jgi:hypothetical protein